MNEILLKAIEAHGGIIRWQNYNKVQASVKSGGLLFDLLNLPQDPKLRRVTAWLHEQHSSIRPFGAEDNFADFTSHRIAIQNGGGDTLLERNGTPGELHHHMKEGPWDPLDRATFTGYALWTYLTTPFFTTMPGFTCSEIEPWKEKDEVWYGIRVEFPQNILSHSQVQDFYFGNDYLLRRHDYYVDVAGEFYATQYVHEFIEVDGIKLPAKRRAYKRGTDGYPVRDQLMVWIDFSEIQFS